MPFLFGCIFRPTEIFDLYADSNGQFHQVPRHYFGFETLFERNKIKSAIKIGPNMYLSTNLYGSLWFCSSFDFAPQISKNHKQFAPLKKLQVVLLLLALVSS